MNYQKEHLRIMNLLLQMSTTYSPLRILETIQFRPCRVFCKKGRKSATRHRLYSVTWFKKAFSRERIFAFKDCGGLFKPSKNVIKVYEETEKSIQKMLVVPNGKLPCCKGIPHTIAVSVLNDFDSANVFAELNDICLKILLLKKIMYLL